VGPGVLVAFALAGVVLLAGVPSLLAGNSKTLLSLELPVMSSTHWRGRSRYSARLTTANGFQILTQTSRSVPNGLDFASSSSSGGFNRTAINSAPEITASTRPGRAGRRLLLDGSRSASTTAASELEVDEGRDSARPESIDQDEPSCQRSGLRRWRQP